MKRSGFTLLYVIINLILMWPSISTKSENLPLYSLVTDLKPLLEIQRLVINVLPKIIAEQKSKLSFIKRKMKRFEIVHKKAMEDEYETNYLKNHINRYIIFKTLSRDFSYIKNQTEGHTHTRFNRNSSLRYPSYLDLDEAGRMVLRLQRVYRINVTKLADGLLESAYRYQSYMDLDEAGRMVLRLQRVYRINVTKLADGLLESAYSGSGEIYRETFLPMTTSDCFELSKVIYKNKFYRNGIPWLLEALRLFARDKPKIGLKKYDIIEAISNGYKKLNNTEKQLQWAKKLVGLKPNFDEEIIRDLKVRIDIKKLRKSDNPYAWKDNNKHRDNVPVEAEERKVFRELCRGEQSVARDVKKRLKCWYFPGHHPFSWLARFRAEQLFVRPEVLLVHNAVSDAEMHTMIHIAQPKIKVIPVSEIKARQSTVINLSKGKWFDEDESRYIEPVTQRISDITGYFTTFQRIVVTNYGVGGYYIPHLDSTVDTINDLNDNKDLNSSELHITFRIATALLYLSDVEQGGFTVFPLLGLAVPPEKGAALVWTNVLPSGKADPLMMHGACPVLRGSKWVASKWIDGTGQELKKPCTKRNTSRNPDTNIFQRETSLRFLHEK